MTISSWLCSTNNKNMLLKIVHRGGRVELHDRPILAAEIMLQNPKCCVTHPHVFRQPCAIVPPDTVLKLGQKFYVVPISTIRKLQRVHMKRSPSPLRNAQAVMSDQKHQLTQLDDNDGDGVISICCFFTNRCAPKQSCGCLKQTGCEDESSRRNMKGMEKEGKVSHDSCFMCFFRGGDGGNDSSMESSESKEMNNNRAKGNEEMELRGSPKHQMMNVFPTLPFDHWQPNLERISEESGCQQA